MVPPQWMAPSRLNPVHSVRTELLGCSGSGVWLVDTRHMLHHHIANRSSLLSLGFGYSMIAGAGVTEFWGKATPTQRSVCLERQQCRSHSGDEEDACLRWSDSETHVVITHESQASHWCKAATPNRDTTDNIHVLLAIKPHPEESRVRAQGSPEAP